MKIAIIGAGFTGLSAAIKLLQEGHEVYVFEKEAALGGLAGGFKNPNWDWTLEKSYHHSFTNDQEALALAKRVGQKFIIKKPKTDVFVNGQILPFDSPSALLKFPHLPFSDRLRVGFITFYLKYLGNLSSLENKKALPWLKSKMGTKATNLIWEPLFSGKFGNHKENISLTWFWARIKKRTAKLAYPEGGYQQFVDKLAAEIEKLGGKIYLNMEITGIVTNPHSVILSMNLNTNRSFTGAQDDNNFDKVIVTLPTPIFTKITPKLPPSYVKQISSIPHLSALNLVLTFKKPFLKNTYWLNITNKEFPFLVLAEHTNFMDPKNYNNEHILYIGNYLPADHPYFKKSAKELWEIYKPYLQKINPEFNTSPVTCHLFSQSFAQPIMTPDYLKYIPEFKTPLKNVYLANLDMVYPWDRGTNYAIELGEKIARFISNEKP